MKSYEFQADCAPELYKFILGQGLSKAIRHLVIGGHMLQFDGSAGNLFAEVVLLDVDVFGADVFGAGMLGGVLDECNGGLIIPVDDHNLG